MVNEETRKIVGSICVCGEGNSNASLIVLLASKNGGQDGKRSDIYLVFLETFYLFQSNGLIGSHA